MRKLIILITIALACFLTLNAYAIVFIIKDDKGYYLYACEGSTSHPMRIKLIKKGTYKVLGKYVGKIVTASSESDAALMVCGEGAYEKKNNPSTNTP